MGKKLFDYVIGNPPYNEDFSKSGDNGNYAKPVYNAFMDATNAVAEKVELIHPARFLFDAGSTPKQWNEKMLHDPHFKVLKYVPDSSKVFASQEIKGGVAITYHNESVDYGAIQIFTEAPLLNSMLKKVLSFLPPFLSLESISVSGYAYHFTEALYHDHPEILTMTYVSKGKEVPLISTGHKYDLKSNIIDKLPMVFLKEKPSDGEQYAMIVGRENQERVNRYIKRSYLNNVSNFDRYKIFLPKAAGVGEFGEALPSAIIAGPGTGSTETFFSIGSFSTNIEACNLDKYLKTKCARALLSITKKTQMMTPGNFKYVPLQNFTPSSDIDWSNSIHEIDLQLYHKYGFDEDEINYIETNVKEMD